MTDDPITDDPMIAALLREREGYLQRGLADRVAQVDEQLALRGHTPPAADSGPGPAAAQPPKTPRGRRAPRQSTT